MRAATRRKILLFLFGLLLVSILTALGTIAFMGAQIIPFIRNVIITDGIFIALFVIWARVNKGYETIYKSELAHEHGHAEEK